MLAKAIMKIHNRKLQKDKELLDKKKKEADPKKISEPIKEG